MVLWRGYFQSVRPAIGRILINIDTATGVMYKPGRLIDLALEFINRSGRPNALAPRHGLPERERMRLQHFLSGVKITTPHSPHHQGRTRLVKKLTRLSAREETFEVGEGETMTVAEFFYAQHNITLMFPDVICVEVCALSPLSEDFYSASSSSRLRRKSHLSYAWCPRVKLYENKCLLMRSSPYWSFRACVLANDSRASARA